MKTSTPLTAGKSMLGAALAGLSLVSTDAEAAVYIESTDFSDSYITPTDLRSEFTNFLDNNEISGSIATGLGGDNFDYFEVNVAPSTIANIYLRASSNIANPYFGFYVIDSSGAYISEGFFPEMPVPGTTYEIALAPFTTPANGIIRLATNQEGGEATINYSIGTIPEPTSAILGVAGLAAAALRRRRNEK